MSEIKINIDAGAFNFSLLNDLSIEEIKERPDGEVYLVLKGYKGDDLGTYKEKLEETASVDFEFGNFNGFLNEQRNYYFHNGLAAWDIIDTIQAYHNDGIDNTEAGYLFCIMKYLLRYPYKGNSSGDLEKAKTYIDRLIDYIKK